MKKPKLRELGEALAILFKRGPYTSTFPAKPYVAPETYRGKPEYDEKECVGCGACAKVCPARAIEVIDNLETRKRTLVLNYGMCIFCGQCHANCTTTDGIAQTTQYDLATLDRSETMESVEKELLLCEHCGGVVGTREHLCWIAKRLGAKAAANPSLVLASAAVGVPVPVGARAGEHAGGRPDRSEIMRILCPTCRRSIFLSEEWT